MIIDMCADLFNGLGNIISPKIDDDIALQEAGLAVFDDTLGKRGELAMQNVIFAPSFETASLVKCRKVAD